MFLYKTLLSHDQKVSVLGNYVNLSSTTSISTMSECASVTPGKDLIPLAWRYWAIISQQGLSQEVAPQALAEMMLQLQALGLARKYGLSRHSRPWLFR
jgi:hypothetical protein